MGVISLICDGLRVVCVINLSLVHELVDAVADFGRDTEKR
jgi:hypothetical protein